MRAGFNVCKNASIIAILCIFQLTLADDFHICLDGKHHKEQPTPERNLKQCKAWKDLSCCKSDVAEQLSIDGSKLYNFNYSHCSSMSESCLLWFVKNHCFYECSPNLGPWLIKVNSSYRNEKFENLPLCKRDCDDWWNACKHEKTCVVNWSKGFKWSKSGNRCPNGSTCQTFENLFPNSTHFCENIYGPHDYVVTPSDEKCLTFNFTGSNPNTRVAMTFDKARKSALNKDLSRESIPPYVPPTSTPLLKVNGTVVSVVLASLVVVVICVVGLVYVVRSMRKRRFWHQGVPIQVKDVFSKQRNDAVAESEMSFMRYEEDDEDCPELNGALRMDL